MTENTTLINNDKFDTIINKKTEDNDGKFSNDYHGLLNDKAICWLNSCFQMLASLENIKNIIVPANIPNELSSYKTIITLLKQLGNKLVNQNTRPEILTIEAAINEFILNVNNITSMYNSNNLIFKDANENVYDPIDNSKNITAITSGKQTDPDEFFKMFFGLFNPEKNTNLMNKMFGFKTTTHNICLKDEIDNTTDAYMNSIIIKFLNADTEKILNNAEIFDEELKYSAHSKLLAVEHCPLNKNYNNFKLKNHIKDLELNTNHFTYQKLNILATTKVLHYHIVREKQSTELIFNLDNIIKTPLIIPDLLNFKDETGDDAVFFLKAVSCYLGIKGTTGHHIAFCFRDNNWYCFNDKNVKQVTGNFEAVKELVKNNCQHLFYERTYQETELTDEEKKKQNITSFIQKFSTKNTDKNLITEFTNINQFFDILQKNYIFVTDGIKWSGEKLKKYAVDTFYKDTDFETKYNKFNKVNASALTFSEYYKNVITDGTLSTQPFFLFEEIAKLLQINVVFYINTINNDYKYYQYSIIPDPITTYIIYDETSETYFEFENKVGTT